MKYLKIALSLFIIASMTVACNDSKGKSDNNAMEARNQTLQTILERKSVREFLSKEISQDMMQDLLRAGMAAPSSRDRRPWHFIVLSDKELMESLSTQLRNASFLKGANKAIVVCGDTIISENAWDLDCSASIQNILLAAESMGLGAVWTAVYPYEDRMGVVNEKLELPDNIKPLAIIPLGYPQNKQEPKDKFDETRIHQNKW